MIRRIFVIAALACMPVSAQQSGWISRYWDGCKPSCSWSDKPVTQQWGRVKQCNRNNVELPPDPPNGNYEVSSCDGGTAYTCWDMIPFVDPNDPNKAYGFAATPSHECGKCFEVTFDGGFKHGTAYATHKAVQGKKLILMGSNIGYDVGGGQFDFLVPGGGLGNFDSFSPQLGISESSLGKRQGGLLSDCEDQLQWANGTLEQYQTCLKNKCNATFSNPAHAMLLEGCLFYADWLMAANNPTVSYKEVTCPEILGNRYLIGSGGGVPTPGKSAAAIRISTSPDPSEASAFVGDTLILQIASSARVYAHVFDGDGAVMSGLCDSVKWKDGGNGSNVFATGCSTVVQTGGCMAMNCVLELLTVELPSQPSPITASVFVMNSVSVRHKAASLAKNGYAISVRSNSVVFTAAEGRAITKLSVVNLKGRRVFGKAGAYSEIKWDNTARPKGMYLVKMTMSNGAVVQRNLLLK